MKISSSSYGRNRDKREFWVLGNVRILKELQNTCEK